MQSYVHVHTCVSIFVSQSAVMQLGTCLKTQFPLFHQEMHQCKENDTITEKLLMQDF